jgi:protein O-mannosyl-transferase
MSRRHPINTGIRFNPAIFIGPGLALVTFFVYYPVISSKFINCDDNTYVTNNARVQAGLNSDNISWAFTSITSANWHPLTMLSLMADSQFSTKDNDGRRSPMLFHLTNLVLHCASTWLLFWALLRMTGCLWRCAWVAALFGLHPLHVESVAWVAERKDVLSGLFWMLALIAYVRYVEVPAWRRLGLVALLMELGLLAKPMLVTLPFVFLLLDYWPLAGLRRSKVELRTSNFELRTSNFGAGPTGSSFILPPSSFLEKIPLFALSGLFCVVTILAQWQGRAVRSFSDFPLLTRFQNIPVAYAVYLLKLVWPFDLTPFCSLPAAGWPAWQVAAAALLLVAITIAAWKARARCPYLLAGWLWYLGTLVPVIGLVQVGDQAWADRYTYLPLIGIFMALAWGTSDFLMAWTNRQERVYTLGLSTVLALAILTRLQVAQWKDNYHLWMYTIDVQPNSVLAHNNLGVAFADDNNVDQALEQFSAAVACDPSYGIAQYNLAQVLTAAGRRSEAMDHVLRVIEINPAYADAHTLLGQLLLLQGRLEEAVSHLRQALALRPNKANTHFLLGEALLAQGIFDQAAREASEGLKLEPKFAAGHHLLGTANLRMMRWAEASTSMQRAVELRPKEPSYRCDFGLALQALGQNDKAREQYARASRLQSDWTNRFQTQAEKLLGERAAGEHDYNRGLELALEICQATDYRDPQFLETLAAAYAATGKAAQAQETVLKALELAIAANRDDLAKKIRSQMASYLKEKSFEARRVKALSSKL